MADNQGKPAGIQEQLQTAIQNFKNLPKNAQYALLGLAGFFLLVFILRSGDDTPPRPAPVQQTQQQPTVQVPAGARATASQNQRNTNNDQDGAFSAVDANRESLRRGFISQQQMALAKMREELQERSRVQEQEFEQRSREMKSLQQQLQQTMESLNQQMRLMEESNSRQREEISRLADQARRQAATRDTAPREQTYAARPKNRERISQTPLSFGLGAPNVGGDQALLQGVLKTTTGRTVGVDDPNRPKEEERKPFIPPLGFIKGTLLNGVDALAGGGTPTPSLVRLEGRYKTAMNSTVILEGCFMLVEFEGDISTERAKGKPSRMTCVYPDQGAVTYDVNGYVVDAKDGLEGVPGIFFEGDSGRIALSIAAQFAAGVADVVQQSQTTTSVSADGNATSSLTGNEGQAAAAGGVSSSLDRLTDYLIERAERISPFIRIDALRKIHVVLLNGTELRTEGDAWSLLFDADKG